MPTSTITRKERYLLAAKGQQVDRPPVWLMRQAGRYMPEYREMRARYSFRDFCHNDQVSAEATLLPLRLLDVDMLIIFNDILIPLEEMGLKVDFPEGGPQIANPVRTEADLAHFAPRRFREPSVVQSLRTVRARAGIDTPVLGFAGSPFTMAVYAVEGRMTRNHTHIMRMVYEDPALLHEILARLAETTASYLEAQVANGTADGVQIFESWGGQILPHHLYEEFAASYQKRVIQHVRRACPGTPIHLFVRGSAGHIESMNQVGADVLGIDWSVTLAGARLRTPLPLQGNLEPMAMVLESCVEQQVRAMVAGFDMHRGWIANLGHGITPEATTAAARKFVQAVRKVAAGG